MDFKELEQYFEQLPDAVLDDSSEILEECCELTSKEFL